MKELIKMAVIASALVFMFFMYLMNPLYYLLVCSMGVIVLMLGFVKAIFPAKIELMKKSLKNLLSRVGESLNFIHNTDVMKA